SEECTSSFVAACTSASRFAFRKTEVKRREALSERRNRCATTIIVAHDITEKRRRMVRTVFPTTPVCRNAVQSCTGRSVARENLKSETREVKETATPEHRRAGPRGPTRSR